MTDVSTADGGSMPLLDLGAMLRRLRRHADLSQRQLAVRAGVPQSTVGRIESGNADDPRFRTVERLVLAAGGQLTVGGDRGDVAGDPAAHLGESERDAAERHYPAHLDVRRVVKSKDWWGAWWANWYELPRHLWPRAAPAHTFDLDRGRRDRRRFLTWARAAVAAMPIERLPGPGPPPTGWHWIARDRNGQPAGHLVVSRTSGRLAEEDEAVLRHIEVAPEWRGCGLGRRLVAVLRAALVAEQVPAARVVIDEIDQPVGFFISCGFSTAVALRPAALRLPARRGG